MTAALLALLVLLPAAAAGGEEPVDVWQQLQKNAPDAAFTRLDSAVQRLRDLEGKIVVLDRSTRC
jgi:ABC-type nitrate/sulfonate/bicarbonate transport system substrate-binding protein